MRSLFALTAVAAMLMSTGCALLQPVQEMSDFVKTSLKPRGHDYRMTADEATGEWDFVGIEGRGDKPLEKSNDPLRHSLMSPKAREIERNLGIGD